PSAAISESPDIPSCPRSFPERQPVPARASLAELLLPRHLRSTSARTRPKARRPAASRSEYSLQTMPFCRPKQSTVVGRVCAWVYEPLMVRQPNLNLHWKIQNNHLTHLARVSHETQL